MTEIASLDRWLDPVVAVLLKDRVILRGFEAIWRYLAVLCGFAGPGIPGKTGNSAQKCQRITP